MRGGCLTHSQGSKYILVVEDSDDLRALLKRLFESENFLVEFASNGKEALEFLEAAHKLPALILLDLMMPVMDGFQFRKEQEKNARLADIPIVVMTANGQIEAQRYRVGAKAFIRKPLDIDNLLNVTSPYCM